MVTPWQAGPQRERGTKDSLGLLKARSASQNPKNSKNLRSHEIYRIESIKITSFNFQYFLGILKFEVIDLSLIFNLETWAWNSKVLENFLKIWLSKIYVHSGQLIQINKEHQFRFYHLILGVILVLLSILTNSYSKYIYFWFYFVNYLLGMRINNPIQIINKK